MNWLKNMNRELTALKNANNTDNKALGFLLVSYKIGSKIRTNANSELVLITRLGTETLKIALRHMLTPNSESLYKDLIYSYSLAHRC